MRQLGGDPSPGELITVLAPTLTAENQLCHAWIPGPQKPKEMQAVAVGHGGSRECDLVPELQGNESKISPSGVTGMFLSSNGHCVPQGSFEK